MSEERLLIRAIANPPRPLDRDLSFLQPHAGLCELFSSGETFPDGSLLVATDGSSRLIGPVRRAAWAVATHEGAQAERLAGMDQHIFSAESLAVLFAFVAANYVQKKLLLLCDNLNVVRRVRQLQKGYPLPQWAPGVWKAIVFHCQQHDIAWVPAHGRHASWTPCRPGHTADMWRALNRLADEKAQKLTDLCAQEIQQWKADFDAAAAWSKAALLRQFAALRGLRARMAALQPASAG